MRCSRRRSPITRSTGATTTTWASTTSSISRERGGGRRHRERCVCSPARHAICRRLVAQAPRRRRRSRDLRWHAGRRSWRARRIPSRRPSTRRRSTRSRPSAGRAFSTRRGPSSSAGTAAISTRVEQLVEGPDARASEPAAGASRLGMGDRSGERADRLVLLPRTLRAAAAGHGRKERDRTMAAATPCRRRRGNERCATARSSASRAS